MTTFLSIPLGDGSHRLELSHDGDGVSFWLVTSAGGRIALTVPVANTLLAAAQLARMP